jgi:hypothetical protein
MIKVFTRQKKQRTFFLFQMRRKVLQHHIKRTLVADNRSCALQNLHGIGPKIETESIPRVWLCGGATALA